MLKIVINTSIGGFSLSRKAWLRLRELGNPNAEEWEGEDEHRNFDEDGVEYEHYCSGIERDDPQLLQVIEELGLEVVEAGSSCKLKVVEIPDGVRWGIWEFDYGAEVIYDKDRFWF